MVHGSIDPERHLPALLLSGGDEALSLSLKQDPHPGPSIDVLIALPGLIFVRVLDALKF